MMISYRYFLSLFGLVWFALLSALSLGRQAKQSKSRTIADMMIRFNTTQHDTKRYRRFFFSTGCNRYGTVRYCTPAQSPDLPDTKRNQSPIQCVKLFQAFFPPHVFFWEWKRGVRKANQNQRNWSQESERNKDNLFTKKTTSAEGASNKCLGPWISFFSSFPFPLNWNFSTIPVLYGGRELSPSLPPRSWRLLNWCPMWACYSSGTVEGKVDGGWRMDSSGLWSIVYSFGQKENFLPVCSVLSGSRLVWLSPASERMVRLQYTRSLTLRFRTVCFATERGVCRLEWKKARVRLSD
ncbi:hypothetical protein L873DRAFT_1339257 [Choiromyces venosus 120613-1]|uniref:Secreted protein n=1 Tax=Choiromyces venosus 120613-1 TaxID=1336337 RepID=A0A3N4JA57_9PEZI|nr:hypothetical protein L873DRAFT_1339257 [Choiromyces venosus 120613-1]